MSEDKVTKTIEFERSGKTFTQVVVQVIPEDISESEIERIINDPVRVDPIGDLKEYWISRGRRPCANTRCTIPVPLDAPPTRKYCSEACRQQAKSARYREKYPKAKKKADLEYLRSLPPEDFID
jgi:hypothetical protein